MFIVSYVLEFADVGVEVVSTGVVVGVLVLVAQLVHCWSQFLAMGQPVFAFHALAKSVLDKTP